MRSVILASLFAGAALSAPAPTASGTPPPAPSEPAPYPTKFEQVFSLVAKVTKQRTSGAPLNINNYYFTSVHVGAAQDTAFLIPSNGSNPLGINKQTFVQNGTTEEVMYDNGYVERYPPTPGQGIYGVYGIVVGPSTAPLDSGLHYVGVNGGPGSPRTGIAYPFDIAFPEDRPELVFSNSTVASYGSQFVVCETELKQYGQTVPEVYWRSSNATTPANCAEVVFFSQCEGNVTAENAKVYKDLQKSTCYQNAAAIPPPPKN